MRTVMMLNRILQTMFKGKAKPAVMALVMSAAVAVAAGAQVPAVVFNQTNGLCGVGAGGCGDFSATGSKLGVNSRGDVFIPAATSNSQFIEEIPANGGAPVIVFNGLTPSYGGRAVYVDSGNNLWYGYADSVNYSVDVIYVPFRNGAYAPNVSYSSLSGTAGQCSFPVPQSQTTTCRVQLNYGGAVGYYVQAADLAMDGAGDLYLLIKYEGPCYPGPTCYNEILKFDTSNNESAIDATLPNNSGGPEFTVSNSGEIFYVDGNGNNYYYAAGATYPGTGSRVSMPFYYIVGIARDAGGNVYLTQNNNGGSIIELPFVNGSACQTVAAGCSNDQYVLSYALGGYTNAPSNGVAVNSFGKVFYLGSYPNSINTMTVGQQAFGSVTLGQSSGTQTVQVTFGNNNAYKTFGSFKLTGPFSQTATTCASGTTYGPYATNSCTVTLQYTPTAAGAQTGSVQAIDSNNNLIGEAELSGTGIAPAIDVDPGTVSTVGAAVASPQAIAVDASGNTYVADKTTGKIYKTAAGATTSTAVATGFASPTAVAVDGAGDLFVADSSAHTVVEIAYVNGSYSTTQQVVANGLKGASGLAVDDLGNVYVADSGNGRVLLLSTSGNQAIGSITTTLTGTYTTPVAVAVDGAQNVYVADAGTKKVTSFNVPTGVQGTVVSSPTPATGVATDPGGGLFVLFGGTQSIVHIPSIGGTLTPNSEVTLGTIVAAPSALAADSAGNVYAVDNTNNTVGKMTRTAGLLSFGNVEEMTATAATAATVSNEGTASIKFSSPYYSATGSTADFAVQSSSTCANGATLGIGAACSVSAVFTPQGAAIYTDTLTFAGTPTTASTLVLTGVGVNLPRTTTTITSITPASPTYGQAITIVATVALVVTGTPTPTGTVTFAIDGVNQVPTPLNGTTATLVIPQSAALGGGTHSISATYNGSATYAGSATPTVSTVTVAQAVTTDTLVITGVYNNLTSQLPGTNVTFTATIAPQLSAVPTGTVTFSSNGATLATVPVVGGVGTLNTASLAPGSYNVVATYSGDANYVGSASTPAQPLIISNPTTVTTTSSNSIVGGGGPVTLTLYSVSGYANTADLSCTGLPAYAVCSFNPPYVQIQPGIPQTVQLSVLINQPPVIAVPGALGALPNVRGFGRYGWLAMLLFLLPVVVGCVRLQRASCGMPSRMLSVAFLLLMLGGCTAVFSGCGGSSTQSYLTPKGSSTINVLVTLSTQPNPTPNPPAAQTIPFTLIVN
jgi:sugar lactone lactonase YvrE